jgi:hypothetical protein
MVNKLKKCIQNELITALYEDCPIAGVGELSDDWVESMAELMAEPKEVREQREDVKARESALIEAARILDSSRAMLVSHGPPPNVPRPSPQSVGAVALLSPSGNRSGTRNPMMRVARLSSGSNIGYSAPPSAGKMGARPETNQKENSFGSQSAQGSRV